MVRLIQGVSRRGEVWFLVVLAASIGGARAQVDTSTTFSGNASSYMLSGTGACGFDSSEVSTHYAALNGAQHGSGEWCGAWLEVTGSAGTTAVQVVDVEPVLGSGNLDLSQVALQAVAGSSSGLFPVTWRWISAPGDIGPIRYWSKGGSSNFYLELQAANTVNPVASMEFLAGGGYVAMTRTNDNHFVYTTGSAFSEPFTVRVTDILGSEVVASGLTLSQTATGQSGSANFPPFADIRVEQPSGTPVLDGESRDIGVSVDGEATSLDFVILNLGGVALSGISISKSGADAADFTVTSAPSGTIATSASTMFTVEFATTSTGLKTAQIQIANSSVDPALASYEIDLVGLGLSSANDSDGDGLNDGAEARLSALGFDWEVTQTDLVDLYYDEAELAGLFTASQVQAMNLGTPVIERDPVSGAFTLTLGLQKSTSLSGFAPFAFADTGISVNGSGELEFEFLSPDDAAFFRVEAD